VALKRSPLVVISASRRLEKLVLLLVKAFNISPDAEVFPTFFSFPIELGNGMEDVWINLVEGFGRRSCGGNGISWGGEVGDGGRCVPEEVGIDDGECSLVTEAGLGDGADPVPCTINYSK
jgi:hypothetical protein